MKSILIVVAAAMLIGCGADTMSAAATAAALKKQEVEQGKRTMDRFQEGITAATGQMEQSARKAADAADSN